MGVEWQTYSFLDEPAGFTASTEVTFSGLSTHNLPTCTRYEYVFSRCIYRPSMIYIRIEARHDRIWHRWLWHLAQVMTCPYLFLYVLASLVCKWFSRGDSPKSLVLLWDLGFILISEYIWNIGDWGSWCRDKPVNRMAHCNFDWCNKYIRGISATPYK